MTFKERVQKTLASLKWPSDKKAYTKEETTTFVAKYNEEHDSDFSADLQQAQASEAQVAAINAAMTALANLTGTSAEAEGGEGEGDEGEGEGKPVDVAKAITAMGVKMAKLEADNLKLAGKLEEDNPKVGKMKVDGFAMPHTKDFLFGIESSMFDMKKRWNKIAINPKLAKIEEPSETDEKAFQTEVNAFGKQLAGRFAYLSQNNLLDPVKLMASTTVDISEVGAALGNYYAVRRTDALIARLLSVKSITDFFPVRSGILDMEIINNVLVGEVSSAWQKGKYFKGSINVKPEMGHVDTVSIKLQFEPLTDIEQNYLGYKNTNGSDAVKFGMIEYYAMVILEKALIEQNKRRVMGCAVKPETGKPGSYLNAATGIYFTLIRYAHQYKMQLLSNAAYASYDSTTFLATVNALLAEFAEKIGDDDIDQYTVLLNSKHKPWWVKNVRAEYGKDSDYTGVKSNQVPDYELPIYWMPAMGDNMFITLTKAGNIQCLENIPGEILGLKFETDFEDVLARARAKEGVSAAFVGEKFSTAALLAANDFELQQIFMNKPALAIADDSVTLDGTSNFWFETQDNTTADKKILEISGAKAGQVYIIECGGATKPQSIDKALKFANLTAAWTPTAVGDYIMVILDDAGTAYRELERCVAGVRSVNTAVQPTLPEAR